MFVTKGTIMLKSFNDILYMGLNLSEHDKYIVTNVTQILSVPMFTYTILMYKMFATSVTIILKSFYLSFT